MNIIFSSVFVVLAAYVCKCSIATLSSQWNYTVYVDPYNGNDTESCYSTTSDSIHAACATLEYVINKVKSSTQVMLVSGIHSVSKKMLVSNCQHIGITGMDPGNTTVQCTDGSNAGFEFVSVSDIQVSGIEIEHCGYLFNSTTKDLTEKMVLFRSGMYILNSTNVTFESVGFINNRGVGLALFDVNGSVSILESNFSGNAVPKNECNTYNGGGGLYIEHTYCTPGLTPNCDFRNNPHSSNTLFNISNCQFNNNHGSNVKNQSATLLVYQKKTNSRRLGNGGGITMTLKGFSNHNRLSITGCTFESNSAGFGGGIDIQLQDYVTNNSLWISNCHFVDNSAVNGGGGVFIGIFFYVGDTIYGNNITLSEVSFMSNWAQYGGGSGFTSSRMRSSDIPQNLISFLECSWHNNSAMLGAGLLLDPEAWSALTDGLLPIPLLKDCTFTGNLITTDGITNAITDAAEGTLYSSTYTLNISSSVQFIANNGTALSATAGSINILKDTVVTFRDNTGIQGGALALLEFATLQIFPRTQLDFNHNFASDVGGAIYAAVHDTIDFYYSRNCFIRYHDLTVNTKNWNVTITFQNNSAGISSTVSEIPEFIQLNQKLHDQHGARGDSIFAETILPCIRAADKSGSFDEHPEDAFPEEVYHFDSYCKSDILCEIATAPSNLTVNPKTDKPYSDHDVLMIPPGEVFDLQLRAKDELNHTVHPVVLASIVPSSASAVLDSTSQYVVDGTVQISGIIGASFSLELSTFSRKKVTKLIRVQLSQCPPGFVFQNGPGKYGRCVCSANTQNQQYQGITKCNTEHGLQALLNKGFWAGCNVSGDLQTAECPLGYCRSNDDSKPFYNLPGSCEGLVDYLCKPRNRTGDLCGKCNNNFSVFYHSQRFSCHTCHLGHLGWLFYALSELLPTMIVFVFVMVFNIRLTSGTWYSVVLYAQIVDFYEVNSLEFFELPAGFAQLTSIYRFVYGMFNLDFFKYEDKLSFCLWDGATVLDVLAFKYLTTAFALILLGTLILCFRSPCWSKCQTVWEGAQRPLHPQHNNSWVIHGISTFLVISYAQCAKVSFEILTWTQMLGAGYVPAKKVVFLSGTVEYFSTDHLPYAIPALLVVLLIVLPPLLLMLYPNGVQVISKICGEREIMPRYCRCCGVFRRYVQIARFKPVIDSFQGCFKDRYRFFAGLFFFYRFVISLSFAFATNAVSLYISLEMIVILMLAFHAWAQPYEKRFYNLVDTFMLSNLAIVNGLSLFNYYWVNYSSASDKEVIVALAVQLFLIYLPIFYVVIMCGLFVATSCSRRARRFLYKVNMYVPLFREDDDDMELYDNVENVPFDDEHLPHRMFEDEDTDGDEQERLLVRERNNYGAANSEPATDRGMKRVHTNKTV